MLRSLRLLTLAALVVLVPCAAARAAEVRLLASDASGVTLRLDVGAYTLTPEGDDGRLLPLVDGLERTALTGRPRLPFGRALLAVPPGARIVARVVAAGPAETRENVRIAIGGEPAMAKDDKLGMVPVLKSAEPIRDGSWPAQGCAVGEAGWMRDRRLVPIAIYPFRYDEAAARLTLTRSLTVRVDFLGGVAPGAMRGTGAALPGAVDHHEGVFANTVLNWEQARAWRNPRPAVREAGPGLLRGRPSVTSLAPASGAAAAAFDEDTAEVRVRVDTTGVYALPFDTLAAFGYPSGVPIGEVSVHRHEFVQDASPPYVTYELPIEVDDVNGNGIFDSGDRIVLWVWDWAHRSRASWAQREWGDGEVIYVTLRPGGAGLRVAHRSGWLGRAGLTPLASYPTSRIYRVRQSYANSPPDTLTDQFEWTTISLVGSSDQFNYDVSQIDPSQPESLRVQWFARTGPQRVSFATTTNGLGQTFTALDSVVWSGVRSASFTGALPPGAVTEGLNRIAVGGRVDTSGAAFNTAGLQLFELRYWRRFVPLSGYLACNSGGQSSVYEISAGPFSNAAALRAYDVSDSLNPARLDGPTVEVLGGGGVNLHLQDSTSAGRPHSFVICETPRSPTPGAFSRVVRHQIYALTSGDYLMVVPEGYLAGAQPLADLHRRQGLRVVVAPLEGINDEFNGGRRSSYAIRRFIRYAYNRWDAQFTLLVGDGSEDPQHFMPFSSPDLVPVQKVPGPVGTFDAQGDYLHETLASDTWYTFCLDCPDPILSPPLLDMPIGRLPVSSIAMLNAVVAKVVKYDDLSGDQTWRRNILLFADDMYSTQSTFTGQGSGYCRHPEEGNFLRIDQVVDTNVVNSAGLPQVNIELFNLSYYLPNLPGSYVAGPGPTDTCRVPSPTPFITRARSTATPALFQRLNAGRFWWSYQGHANEFVLSHESFYLNLPPALDVLSFMNDGRPFLFTAFSCHPNAFAHVNGADPQYGPALGEDMVTLPGGGAIASYASGGFESIPIDYLSQLHIYVARAMLVDPPRDEVLGDHGARDVLGEVLQEALVDNYYGRLSSPTEQYVAISYQLLGDPGTRLSLGPPMSGVTANSVPVVSGQDIRLHTPGDTLRIDADLGSNVRLDSLRLTRTGPGPGPTVTIWQSSAPPPPGLTVTPPFPDTSVATGVYGGRRFHLTWRDSLLADTYHYSIASTDRYGQSSAVDADFGLRTLLQVGGSAIADEDVVSPIASLTMQVLCPRPLNPPADLTLTVDGVVQPFTPSPANADPSGREWILAWTHAPYPPGSHAVKLAAAGGAARVNTFRVSAIGAAVELHNVMAFPNPFDDDYLRALVPGSDQAIVFSFDLVSATPADVTLRVYTISGRLIYQHTERALDARYHQLGWNGHDAEGYPLANGVYFYRLLARNGTGTTMAEGRLVKLRRPRRGAAPSP